MSQCVSTTNRDAMKAALGARRVQISGSTPNFTVVFQQKKISLTRYEQYTEADTKSLDLRQTQPVVVVVVVFIDGSDHKSHAAS